MEEHAEGPACQPKVSEQKVVFSERVGCWDLLAELCHAVIVGEEVEEGEDDREGLLHA